MGDKPRKSRAVGTETGVMPRVEADGSALREPPQPAMPPEFDEDFGGITGALHINPEGEDRAKQEDDSANES